MLQLESHKTERHKERDLTQPYNIESLKYNYYYNMHKDQSQRRTNNVTNVLYNTTVIDRLTTVKYEEPEVASLVKAVIHNTQNGS